MRTGWLGALSEALGVGGSDITRPSGGGGSGPSMPPTNLAQSQHGFSAANPGPAWSTWDSYPTYIQTQAQPVSPYTAACGQWSAPLGKNEIDGFLYSTAVMLVEHANGQPVTQQTAKGLFLFALENEMVTVRKCLAPSVPIQQAKFSALAGFSEIASGMLAGLPLVGLGDCGPGCTSCPFCKGEVKPFGGVVVGVGDSCGHVHPAVCLPDPPAFREGAPCGGPPVPLRYFQQQPLGTAFTGLGAPPASCGSCADDVGLGGADVARVSPGASTPVPGSGSGPWNPSPSGGSQSTAGGGAGPPPPFAFQKSVQPGQSDGFVTPLTYVPVAQQMPLRPPGKMAYQPTLPWWTVWHKDEQQAFNCWWANQQFAHPVCGLGQVANFPATPDFDQLKWVIRMGLPFSAEVQCGLAAGPVNKPHGGRPLEALAVLATAVGSAALVVVGLKAVQR